jgi:hypothetical protein
MPIRETALLGPVLLADWQTNFAHGILETQIPIVAYAKGTTATRRMVVMNNE